MEYIIWCDESIKKGNLYSNFYGGALVSSVDADEIIQTLNNKKDQLNLFGEIKWTKITEQYESKYIEMIDSFFRFIADGKIKLRIMFTDNAVVPIGLSKEQIDKEFFLLYYQFIKHAFGLTKIKYTKRISLHLNFDKIPDSNLKSDEFKSHIFGLNYFFNDKNIFLHKDNISEVSSHKHVVLQCLDVVLGSMAFKLNKMHLEKPAGQRCRGRKTRAKERVYKHINSCIQNLYPNYSFNIGISTGNINSQNPYWEHPYRHWVFKPRQRSYDADRKKQEKAQ